MYAMSCARGRLIRDVRPSNNIHRHTSLMTTRLFLVCDAATVHAGKMNILGTFDTITASDVPCTHASFAIAAIIDYTASEEGEHRVKIVLVDEDGKDVHAIFDRKITFAVGDSLRGTHRIRCTENSRTFERFGEYSIQLSVDAHQIAEIPLYVNQCDD
mgnify:FL=1